jgi:PAS domain S-box-containing protein
VQEDVTEEVAAARELREERALLKLATEAAGIGIWDQDVAARRMTYSSRARAIFGIPEADELTPERIYMAIHPDDRARVQANARAALDPQVRRREPYEYRGRSRRWLSRWILGLGEAIFKESEGEPRAVRYLGTIQDITARHDLEGGRATRCPASADRSRCGTHGRLGRRSGQR